MLAALGISDDYAAIKKRRTRRRENIKEIRY